jgi:hypothetical protein
MAKLTDTQKDARALRDLYAQRYGLTTWGFIWRIGFLSLWILTIIIRTVMGIPPTWLTPIFAVMFTVISREVWDGYRRRRFDRWQDEQLIKKKNEQQLGGNNERDNREPAP